MDITNDIISFIFAEKQLSLPGLGILSLSQSTAHRSPARTKIYSPKFSIELQDSDYDKAINEKFYQYVANKHKKSIRKVEDEINKFSINILNNLANFNSAQIENLGSFKRVNDKIQFEFSPIFNDLLKESYPDFPLLQVDRKHMTSEKESSKGSINAVPPVSSGRTKEIKKPGWIFPLIVLTLLSLGFVCLMYCLSSVLPDHSNISQKQSGIIIDSQSTNNIPPTQNIVKDSSSILKSKADTPPTQHDEDNTSLRSMAPRTNGHRTYA